MAENPNLPFITRVPDYSDLDLDFLKHPKTKQLVLKTGREAVIRSVRNLVFTNYYERPFQSGLGSNIRALLFENFTPTTLLILQDEIRRVLKEYEPRIEVEDVIATENIDEYRFEITIKFIILNRNEPVVTSVFLERIR